MTVSNKGLTMTIYWFGALVITSAVKATNVALSIPPAKTCSSLLPILAKSALFNDAPFLCLYVYVT